MQTKHKVANATLIAGAVACAVTRGLMGVAVYAGGLVLMFLGAVGLGFLGEWFHRHIA